MDLMRISMNTTSNTQSVHKMKVLQLNKLFFTILGLYPFHQIKKPYDAIIQTFSFYFVFIIFGAFVCAIVTYIYQHFHSLPELPDVMLAFIALVGSQSIYGSYVSSIVLNKRKLDDLTDELQKSVDRGES